MTLTNKIDMFHGQVKLTYDEGLKGDVKNKWKNVIGAEKGLLKK